MKKLFLLLCIISCNNAWTSAAASTYNLRSKSTTNASPTANIQPTSMYVFVTSLDNKTVFTARDNTNKGLQLIFTSANAKERYHQLTYDGTKKEPTRQPTTTPNEKLLAAIAQVQRNTDLLRKPKSYCTEPNPNDLRLAKWIVQEGKPANYAQESIMTAANMQYGIIDRYSTDNNAVKDFDEHFPNAELTNAHYVEAE